MQITGIVIPSLNALVLAQTGALLLVVVLAGVQLLVVQALLVIRLITGIALVKALVQGLENIGVMGIVVLLLAVVQANLIVILEIMVGVILLEHVLLQGGSGAILIVLQPVLVAGQLVVLLLGEVV